MSDIVGSAAIQFEPTGEAEFAAALESQVLAALQAVSEQLGTIDAQVAGLAGSLSDVGADVGTIDIGVEADTSAAESDLESFADLPPPPISVDVEADTASIEEVAAAVAAIDGESIEIDVTVDESGGEGLDEVTGKVEDLKTQALAAGAATFGIGALFAGALEAQGSLESFNLRVGEFADEVNSIDVGGLNADLGELAIQLGSSDEEARNALASLFQVGESAGLAGPDIVEMTDNVAALAARAVALNPELGSVGEVIEGLSTGLARGGRFLSRYGLSLTAAEITARALADTGKETATELTQVEKQAAGAAIAVERLGPSLGEDVAAGAENAQIRLRSLNERLGEIVETVGAPLVEPVISGFDSLATTAEELTPVMGDLAAADVEVAVSLIDVINGSEQAASSLGGLENVGQGAISTVEGISFALESVSENAPVVSDAIFDLIRSGLGPLDSALRAFEATGSISELIIGEDGGNGLGEVALNRLNEALIRTQGETAGLSDVSIENAIATNTNAEGVLDLQGAYNALEFSAQQVAASQQAAADETERTTAILEREAEKATAAAQAEAELIQAAAEQAATSLAGIGQNTIDSVGVITAAFEDLNDDGTTSLYEFTTNLETQFQEQAQFLANIRDLQARGADDLALALFEAGADGQAAAAEAAILNDEQLAEREAFIDEQNALNDLLAVNFEGTRAQLVTTADRTAKDVEKALAGGDLAGVLGDDLLNAELAAAEGGFDVGEAAMEGFESGILSKREALKMVAKDQADAVADTWRNVLGVFSPSKVFEEIGQQTIAGFTLGLDSGVGDAERSAAAVVASVGGDSVAPISGGTSIGDVNVNITLPPGVDTSDPVALGKGIGEGILGVLVRGA